MKDRKEILDFLETTRKLDYYDVFMNIRDEWHYEDMVDALNLLAEEYGKLNEKYRKADNNSSDYDMMTLFSNNLLGIQQMKDILKKVGDTEFEEEIKHCLVGIILSYHRFLKEFTYKKEGAKA